MKIDIITIFPEMFSGPFEHSIVRRAKEQGRVDINIHNLRDWTTDKHKSVDDKPYGGGAGMVLMVEPIYKAVKDLKMEDSQVILLSPQGKTLNQTSANKIAKNKHLILIAGHYEGYDQRIRKYLIDQEISIGDYVLTGGELPAMILVDAVVRLIPGVLGDQDSLVGETHSKPGLTKHPVYTRPEVFMDWKVPEVLLSGNHQEIKKWQNNNNQLKPAEE